jgi:hypothetical protein
VRWLALLNFFRLRGVSARARPLQISLCLCDGVPSIVIWIAFFVGAIVRDALNDDFRIIPTGQGSFRVSPVRFRLTAMTGGHPARAAERLGHIFRGFRRIFVEVKVWLMVHGVGFVARSDEECFVVFLVRESRQPKQPGNIRGGWIPAVLRSQSTQERFRLARIKALDTPDDLMFSGRSVENEVRWWHVARSADGLKRGTGFLVEVEISVAYLADCSFVRLRDPSLTGFMPMKMSAPDSFCW